MKTTQEKNIEIFAELIKANIPNYKTEASDAFNKDFKKLWENKKYEKENIELYKLLKDKYRNEKLNRQTIISLFKNEETYYEGFLCAMIWGKIGSYNIEWYNSVFKSNNEQTIKKVVNLLKRGNIEGAYNYLRTGTGKINGVNEAFFTKLLYFAGAALMEENQSILPFQPLIFDSIMKGIYVRLSKFIIGSKIPDDSYERYKDYCNMMGKLNEYLGLDTPGHVEALLFRPVFRK